MTLLLAALAFGAAAAQSPAPAAAPLVSVSSDSAAPATHPETPPVFEISVRIALKEEGKEARIVVEKRVREAGGAELLTGSNAKVAFSFGRGLPAALRPRLLQGIDALAGAGAMQGERERLLPPYDARADDVSEEQAQLALERGQLTEALAATPRARALIDDRLAALASFDPAREEREGILLIFIDRAGAPASAPKQ